MHKKDTKVPPAPPPPDPTAGIVAMAGSQAIQTMFVSTAQTRQAEVQANMMTLQGLFHYAAQQERLDANLQMAQLNYDARITQMEYDHRENMVGLSNDFVQELADGGHIEIDSGPVKVDQYKYQYS